MLMQQRDSKTHANSKMEELSTQDFMHQDSVSMMTHCLQIV